MHQNNRPDKEADRFMVPRARKHALHRRPHIGQLHARAAELVVASVHGGVWWVLAAGSGAAMEAQRGVAVGVV